jgi:hypothetical protein
MAEKQADARRSISAAGKARTERNIALGAAAALLVLLVVFLKVR